MAASKRKKITLVLSEDHPSDRQIAEWLAKQRSKSGAIRHVLGVYVRGGQAHDEPGLVTAVQTLTGEMKALRDQVEHSQKHVTRSIGLLRDQVKLVKQSVSKLASDIEQSAIASIIEALDEAARLEDSPAWWHRLFPGKQGRNKVTRSWEEH